MTVDEFIQAIIAGIIHPYHQQGFAYYEKKEYEKSIEYFKRTLDYNPKYVPAYHAIAVMQHTMGLEQKDLNLLRDAEGNLLKALEIDPNHKMSKTELENVRKNIKLLKSR